MMMGGQGGGVGGHFKHQSLLSPGGALHLNRGNSQTGKESQISYANDNGIMIR